MRTAHSFRRRGLLAASMGTALNPGTFVQHWLGAPTYFSGYDSTTNRLLVERAGLCILSAREETIQERLEGRVSSTAVFWVVAQRPDAARAPHETTCA